MQTPTPSRERSGNGCLTAIAIMLGVALSYVILPLGALALFLGYGRGVASELESGTAQQWNETVVSGKGSDRIVMLDIYGVIGDESGSVTHSDILSQIEQATDDAAVKAVVLRIDSPGGGVVASREIYEALVELRNTGKYIVVAMGSTAASGGYYIAASADRIYAYPDTITGSLGVIIRALNTEGAYEKLGLREVVYKSGPLKDMGSSNRAASEEEVRAFEEVINQAYDGFVQVIMDGRKLPREEVLRIADGRIYTGKQAHSLNLVDELGDYKDAIAGAKELADLNDATVVRYTSSLSLARRFFSLMEAQQQPADPLGVHAVLTPDTPRMEYRWMP